MCLCCFCHQVKDLCPQLITDAEHAAKLQPKLWHVSWEAEYVRSRLMLQRMDDLEGVNTQQLAPPLSLLFAKEEFGRVRISQAARSKARALAQQLAAEHLHGDHPEKFSDPVMQRGLNQWVGAELQRAFEELSNTLAFIRFVDQLATALAGRPQEQRKALRRKHLLRARARTGLGYLQEWGKWACAIESARVVQQWDADVYDLIQWATSADQQTLSLEGCTLKPLARSLAPQAALAHEVWVQQLKVDRLEEEVVLVEKEMTAFLANLQQRINVLQSREACSSPHAALYACELQRVRKILNDANRVFAKRGGSGDSISEEEAAAALLLLGDGEDVDAIANDMHGAPSACV